MAEQLAVNQRVVGSTPTPGANNISAEMLGFCFDFALPVLGFRLVYLSPMSHLLATTNSLEELTKVIERLPVLFLINKVVVLNEGCDNTSIEVNDEWIFRFPKKPDVPTEREIKLLAALKGKFHVQIPVIEYVFQEPMGVCYRKIVGQELTLEELRLLSKPEHDLLVNDMAQFFADLHSAISVNEARRIGIEESFSRNYIDVIRERLLPFVEEADIREFAQACLLAYEQLVPTDDIVVLHTDISPDNMAFDLEKKKLIGVFDFSDVAIGDVNLEFVHLLKFDQDFTKQIVDSYTMKTGRLCDLGRTRLYKQLNTLADFAFQLENSQTPRYQEYLQTFRKWVHNPNSPL